MSRIRSVHPSLFTDEEFMCLSPYAQVFMIGLWTECDDQGVFAWKPMTLKARILPAANADVPALLEELVRAGFVRAYSVDDKSYGAVRNFLRFQRPKAPTAVHPLPEQFRSYVGMKPIDGEAFRKDFPIPPPKSPQMEDGGDKMEENYISEPSVPPPSAAPDGDADGPAEKPKRGRVPYSEEFSAFWSGYPTDPNMSKKEAFDVWRRLPADERDAAMQALPKFRAYCQANPDYRPIHACRFLSKRRAEGFLDPHAHAPPGIDRKLMEAFLESQRIAEALG